MLFKESFKKWTLSFLTMSNRDIVWNENLPITGLVLEHLIHLDSLESIQVQDLDQPRELELLAKSFLSKLYKQKLRGQYSPVSK